MRLVGNMPRRISWANCLRYLEEHELYFFRDYGYNFATLRTEEDKNFLSLLRPLEIWDARFPHESLGYRPLAKRLQEALEAGLCRTDMAPIMQQ